MKKISGWFIAVVALTAPVAANATFTYNYSHDYLYDSSTGLYWQEVPFSTSVYPTDGAAQLATFGQIGTLFASVTGSSDGNSLASSYSPAIADLISFFSNDAPAQTPGTKASGYGFYFSGAYAPSSGTEDLSYGSYQGSSLNSSDWIFYSTALADNWTPGGSNPYLGDDPFCNPNGAGGYTCAAEAEAFFVSTVAPVPIPATVWLLLSGLGGLGAIAVRRGSSSPASTSSEGSSEVGAFTATQAGSERIHACAGAGVFGC